jgi:hypothetical protein
VKYGANYGAASGWIFDRYGGAVCKRLRPGVPDAAAHAGDAKASKKKHDIHKLAITPPPHGFCAFAEPACGIFATRLFDLSLMPGARAIMANEPLDVMAREIDEELRREQLLKLWDKYGVYVLGAVLAVVVGVAGWTYYQHQRVEANETASTQFIFALNDLSGKRILDAQKGLEGLATTAPAGYAALAKLRLAAQQGAEGNILDALKAYEGVVSDESVDSILRDYARLQIAMLKFDSAPFTELRNQISSLASDRSPWRYSARELLGMGAMKAGLEAEARSHFNRLLSDNTTPPGIAERARVMIALLDEAARDKNAAGTAPKAAPQVAPGAEQKPETPSKAEADGDKAGDKAKVAPGKSK